MGRGSHRGRYATLPPVSRTRPFLSLGGLLILWVLALPGCFSNRLPESIWPPDDFRIQVAGTRFTADGRRIEQRFLLERDGLAVYREADRSVPGTSLELQVFDTVSAYRVKPESVRTLARLLERAGLFALDVGQSVNRSASEDQAAIVWRSFGREGKISSFYDNGGVLDRVVHIVNAFVPKDRTFSYPELSGEDEPRHVSRVPEPLRYLDGALLCHRQFADLFRDDADMQLDLFALAYTARNAEVARLALDRIVAIGPGPFAEDLVPAEEWEVECVEPLRSLLGQIGG